MDQILHTLKMWDIISHLRLISVVNPIAIGHRGGKMTNDVFERNLFNVNWLITITSLCTLSLGLWLVRSIALIAMFMGPTWGPSGADRTQVSPMLAPWTLLSGFREWPGTDDKPVSKPMVTPPSDAYRPFCIEAWVNHHIPQKPARSHE